jgi:hypothetical protein
MGVYYEWDIEEVDEHGDIQDHDFRDRLKDFGVTPTIGERYHLVLVRNTGDEYEGVVYREWAYAIKSGDRWVLPEWFDGGARVPKRFHEELARSGL